MAVRQIVVGEDVLKPSILNRAVADLLLGSGYLADGTDFTGFIKSDITLGDGRTVTDLQTFLRNNTRLNIKDYGAIGDGVSRPLSTLFSSIGAAQAVYPQATSLTDELDWAAIQKAVGIAEAAIAAINTYVPQAPVVYLPAASGYTMNRSVTITKPISMVGDGKQVSWIKANGVNVPAVLINLASAQSTYIQFCVGGFGIKGLNVGGSYVTQDLADGIKITGPADISAEILSVRIIGMTGNGIHLFDKNNSPIIHGCVLELNSKAGIRANGVFCTNSWIERNIIRENRIGIQFKSDGGSFLTSGRITRNLIESNNGRTNGTLGSADMPSVGIWLYKQQLMEIDSNYCENHANDLYIEGQVAHDMIHHNQWCLGNSWDLATLYGPPVRPMGVNVGNSGGSSVYNELARNMFYNRPVKPVACSDANWNTAGFGAAYGHVTDLSGTNKYDLNHTFDPTNGQVIIDQGAGSRHIIINAEQDPLDGAGRAVLKKLLYKSRDIYLAHEWKNTDAGYSTLVHRGTASPPTQGYEWPAVNAGYKVYEETLFTDLSAGWYTGRRNAYGTEYKAYASGATRVLHVWMSAAPVAGGRPDAGGDWQVGDVGWNVAGAAGGVSYWECRTPGSPGVWEAVGIIGEVRAAALADMGALTTVQVAGGGYTANEQTMLANLKADVTALRILVNTLLANRRAAGEQA